MKSTYDPENGTLYISLKDNVEKVGTVEVNGPINYRKPFNKSDINGTILLDFDTDGCLVGIEVIGNNLIPDDMSPISIRSNLTNQNGST